MQKKFSACVLCWQFKQGKKSNCTQNRLLSSYQTINKDFIQVLKISGHMNFWLSAMPMPLNPEQILGKDYVSNSDCTLDCERAALEKNCGW